MCVAPVVQSAALRDTVHTHGLCSSIHLYYSYFLILSKMLLRLTLGLIIISICQQRNYKDLKTMSHVPKLLSSRAGATEPQNTCQSIPAVESAKVTGNPKEKVL
jgi:hypothetical protein